MKYFNLLKKVAARLAFVLAVTPGFYLCSAVYAADEFSLLREERIGDLRIGLPEEKVKKTIGCALKRGPDVLWAADRLYHQQWGYVGCGITLDMASEKKGVAKKIESITLVAPSTLSTKRNIRIGSTKGEVINAYNSHWNKVDSKRFGGGVAGSIYGGIMFSFEKDKVTRIFLGAAAE